MSRRYLSVAAGSYPPAVLAKGLHAATSKSGAPRTGEPETEMSAWAEVAVPRSPIEPELPAAVLQFPPVESHAPSGPEPFAVSAQQETEGSTSPSGNWLRTLIGAVGGAVVGLVAALVLLALTSPEERLPMLLRPVELWNSVTDSLVRICAFAIAIAFEILGMTMARRSARSD